MQLRAWRINTGVLGVLEQLWRAKSRAAGLPSQEVLRSPPRPSTAYRLVYDGGALHAK